MNTLDQLPFELLSLILDHVNFEDLPACTLINKRLNQAALPLLWYGFCIESDKELDKLINILPTSDFSPGQHVRFLDISWCCTMSDTQLLAILEHLPYLEKLYFAQAHYFTDASLRQLPSYCPHLTSVDLGCSIHYDSSDLEITNASMFALAQHRQLTHLTLENMTSLDYTTLLDHFHDCPLMHIRIVSPGIEPSARQAFVESATLGLHRHHQQTLTTLYIGYAGEDILTMINTHQLVWPHLTSFNITDCDNITDAMATTFIQAHPQLQKLGIDGSGYLTNQFLDNVIDCLPGLLSLNVSNNPQITGSGICRLIKHYDGQLVDQVWCRGCGICPLDDDFPHEFADTYGYHYISRGDADVPDDDDDSVKEVVCFLVIPDA